MVVNCAALPDPLLESELFGYEEGAFTGAKRGGKAGLFELANGGTLFFDEIGDMSHAVQLRLLRVLDAKEVMHVGGDRFIPVNVRVICASHKQLLDLVKAGSFRLDLYFRLAGVCLEVAPLRDRLEDVPLLIANVLKRYGKNASVVTPGHSGCHPALFLAGEHPRTHVGHGKLPCPARGQQFQPRLF